MAAEALAMEECMADCLYTEAVLIDIIGSQASEIPIVTFKDSKNLIDGLSSTSLVEDKRLCIDIAEMKERYKSLKNCP